MDCPLTKFSHFDAHCSVQLYKIEYISFFKYANVDGAGGLWLLMKGEGVSRNAYAACEGGMGAKNQQKYAYVVYG